MQALDRYAFVNNNPVSFTDPSGHIPHCNVWGWCWDTEDGKLTASLRLDWTSISANVYRDGQRVASQFFIEDKTRLCGAVTFAAILRTRSPSFTGNQIINALDQSKIPTNGTGAGDIAKMARHFGWSATTTNPSGKALALFGDSDKRFNALLGYIRQGWTPIIGMQTKGGYIGDTGGTRHWVGVVGIGVIDGERYIDIYNPINDSVTRYSWNTFYASLSIGWSAPNDDSDEDSPQTHNSLVLIRPPTPTPVGRRAVPI